MDYTKLNLHYLRIYAREIGVKSPSLYKKEILIKKIKQVESGKVEPHFSKMGRPASESFIDVKRQGQGIKLEIDGEEKSVLLFAISRFRKFLDNLEKEIKEKY